MLAVLHGVLGGWKLVPHTSPSTEDGGLGMRTYRGIRRFELVPPTKSIAPVRPAREEPSLFSHSGYNRGNPPSTLRRHPPTARIDQSSSGYRGFVKELRIHAHQLWNRGCPELISIAAAWISLCSICMRMIYRYYAALPAHPAPRRLRRSPRRGSPRSGLFKQAAGDAAEISGRSVLALDDFRPWNERFL